jgi:hypothetical protein
MDTVVSTPGWAASDVCTGPGEVKSDSPTRDLLAIQQQALVAFGRRSSAQPKISVLMQDAAALIGEVLGVDMLAQGEVQGDAVTLTIRPRLGSESPLTPQVYTFSLDVAESIVGAALGTSELTVAANLAEDSRFHDASLVGLGLAGVMIVPLRVSGRPFGVLGAFSKGPREFTLDEITFAEIIAHMLNASIARVEAERQLEQARCPKSEAFNASDDAAETAHADQLASRIDAAESDSSGSPPWPDAADEHPHESLVLSLSDGSAEERRHSLRLSYHYSQIIAPMYGGVMPSKRAFFEVECWDISASGISFLLDSLPDFETLVVALGRLPDRHYFTARVMRVARVDREGKTQYLVGCGFLSRVHL